jgi:iron complex transport system ATP-binding protein
MSEPVVSIRRLHWSYRGKPLFASLDAEFPQASFISIVGPNGCGKTTLLRHILRLLPVPDGTVALFAQELNAYSQRSLAHTLSYVPQQGGLEYDFTVAECVAMGRYSHTSRFSLLSDEDHAHIEQAMEKMGIAHLKKRMATEISGGEFQRMVIARALAQNAKAILLDEPVSHLDPRNQRDILRLLRRLVDEQAATVVCVLHDLNAVSAFSDWVIMLKEGSVVASGRPDEVLSAQKIEDVYHVEVDIHVSESDGSRTIMPRWR